MVEPNTPAIKRISTIRRIIGGQLIIRNNICSFKIMIKVRFKSFFEFRIYFLIKFNATLHLTTFVSRFSCFLAAALTASTNKVLSRRIKRLYAAVQFLHKGLITPHLLRVAATVQHCFYGLLKIL